MDAFEHVISEILWAEGYWTRPSLKVELTKKEKAEIGRPSSPRWELDVVAYNGRDNELLMVECKSYLDSNGVKVSAFNGQSEKDANRYKLFNEPTTFSVVSNRLIEQLAERGLIQENPKIRLVLAAGKVASRSRDALSEHFDKMGWLLWDEAWLKDRLLLIAKGGYDNNIAAVTAKILTR
ncbi:hypothetical protein [uncultured Sulfitobacter sp.]|uniref:hypothetical protein n=1 Tax=uncultured Sulfitobacter sp. TaxID=191468 RepID=UPI0026386871|nr:hypothetical protein [uncultured Sulfitobacter sp.]